MCENRCNNFIENSFNNNFTSDTDGLATGGFTFPTNVRYGNAYVPIQMFRTVYTPANGLANGTMFPELVSPYTPNQSMAEVEYLRNFRESRCMK